MGNSSIANMTGFNKEAKMLEFNNENDMSNINLLKMSYGTRR